MFSVICIYRKYMFILFVICCGPVWFFPTLATVYCIRFMCMLRFIKGGWISAIRCTLLKCSCLFAIIDLSGRKHPRNMAMHSEAKVTYLNGSMSSCCLNIHRHDKTYLLNISTFVLQYSAISCLKFNHLSYILLHTKA